MERKKQRSRKFLRSIERLLWTAGVAALAYCTHTLIQAEMTQARLSGALQRDRHAQARPPQEPVNAGEDRVRSTKRIDPPLKDSLVGRLNIPRLGLSAMVLEGVDARTLRVGLGHIPGTADPGHPGNVGIAGHRDTFLWPLRRIAKGDEVIFETAENTYRYHVSSIQVVEPRNVSVLSQNKNDELTLVTCYPFSYLGAAPRRFIVHADGAP